MVQDGMGSCEAVSDILVSERTHEIVFDGCKNILSKSLVAAVVLVEHCGSCVKSIAKFVDLGASVVCWDFGYKAGVDGNNKSGDG